jgi:molecular chaperone GrpE
MSNQDDTRSQQELENTELVEEQIDGNDTEVPGDRQESVEDEATEATGESIQERLQKLERERDEYLDQWRRSAAEFQNYRKREERLRNERERSASGRQLKRLLPVLDDLQRASQHVPESFSNDDWVAGMLAIERKLWNLLEQEGVTVIEAEAGTPFDPNIHEALMSQESDEIESGHIVSELERGYRLGDVILRPARVSGAR